MIADAALSFPHEPYFNASFMVPMLTFQLQVLLLLFQFTLTNGAYVTLRLGVFAEFDFINIGLSEASLNFAYLLCDRFQFFVSIIVICLISS